MRSEKFGEITLLLLTVLKVGRKEHFHLLLFPLQPPLLHTVLSTRVPQPSPLPFEESQGAAGETGKDKNICQSTHSLSDPTDLEQARVFRF